MRAVFLVIWMTTAFAQPKPKFEVASVKTCDPHTPETTNSGTTPPGRVHYNCVPLTTLIRQLYGFFGSGKRDVGGHQLKIEGGPAWVNTDLYQIEAKAGAVTNAAILDGPIMQSLLEERFKLKLHRETREVPVYALVVAKGGPKVPPAKVACFVLGSGRPKWRPGVDTPPPFCNIGKRTQNGLEVHGATMPEFCLAAWRAVPLDRIMVDRTGVAGRFDFDLKWPDDDVAPPAEGAPVAVMWMSQNFDRMQSALGRLGLRLVDAKGPGEFIVIDHVERPTAD